MDFDRVKMVIFNEHTRYEELRAKEERDTGKPVSALSFRVFVFFFLYIQWEKYELERASRCVLTVQSFLLTIIFFISVIAFAGLRPFGQALAQFRIVWQR